MIKFKKGCHTLKNDTPLVSVCVPTYNGSKFLATALLSIQKQTYENIEVIISDDNSQDNTLEVAENFRNEVQFPVYICKHEPSGIGANWNNCVNYSHGKYIKFLFQDDMLFPECLRKLVSLAETDKDVGVVYCKRSIIGEKGDKNHQHWISSYGFLHYYWKHIQVKQGIIDGKSYLKDENIFNFPGNKIGEPTAVLIRKKCFEKVGYFRNDLQQALDLEFWLRTMKYYKIGFVDEFLVYFRLHKDQASQVNFRRQISDKQKLEKFYYNSLFWYVHPKVRLKLFKKANRSKWLLRSLQFLKWHFLKSL